MAAVLPSRLLCLQELVLVLMSARSRKVAYRRGIQFFHEVVNASTALTDLPRVFFALLSIFAVVTRCSLSTFLMALDRGSQQPCVCVRNFGCRGDQSTGAQALNSWCARGIPALCTGWWFVFRRLWEAVGQRALPCVIVCPVRT